MLYMLSLNMAQQLKDAGLEWKPALHDFFCIPYHDLDEQYFVISELSILIELIGGTQAITFNGSAEWALDYLILTEAVWAPTESQLRTMIEERLVKRGEQQPVLQLTATSDGYLCQIRFNGEEMEFEAFSASEAYGAALLFLIQH